MADPDLRRILGEIQRRGAIGPVDLAEAITHAGDFAAAVPEDARFGVDLGSGGGLPGLVIGVRCRSLQLMLVERRAKRVDLLRYAVRSLGIEDHVMVFDGDANAVVSHPEHPVGGVDVVTARSFGAPEVLLPLAVSLLRPGGVLLVSDPPERIARWSPDDLAALGLAEAGHSGGVRLLQRNTSS